jgi:hypothetical protein
MTRWFDLMRLPLALFSLGAEMFAATMREFQRTLTKAIDAPTGLAGSTQRPGGGSADKQKGDATMPNWSRSDRRDYDGGSSWSTDDGGCDPQSMGDQDLSGTDLKYVEYSILFTKRDLEATLQEQRSDVIDYATNGASFGALKVGEFMAGWRGEPIKRPGIWKSRHYPSGKLADKEKVAENELPAVDRRYITLVYRVKDRLARQAKEYDRQEVEALREIRRAIEEEKGKGGAPFH